jgi:hypothetical protein
VTNVFILSMPRTGSSLLANLVHSAGYGLDITPDSTFLGASEFNRAGYFEENRLTLLDDQLIRGVYGPAHSFLHLPPAAELRAAVERGTMIPGDFDHDIDETTLFIPEGFEADVQRFTGNTWDNWGLTRMRSGGKWHECYERTACRTAAQIRDLVAVYSESFNRPRRLVVKDPRMAPVFHCFKIAKPRVIVLRRDHAAMLKSMRRHYGPNLFTTTVFPGSPYCSNHFNYKVEPQSFDDYVAAYEESFRLATAGAEFLEVDYEHILARGPALDRLDDFLGAKVDRSRIDSDTGN